MPVLRNADHPASQAIDSVFTRYGVAVLGAWAAETVTYPFDLTKTRLQIQSEVAAAKHGYKLENKGMIKTAVGIAKQEGVLKLWTGLMPMFQRHAIYSGCRIIFYEKLRNALKNEDGKVSLASASLGGLMAGSMAQLIASPTDLVKVQMQAEGRRVLQGKEPRFANCRQAYAMLYAESGILGFWRGAIPNVQRAALVNMGDLAAYDYTKQFLMREFGMADTTLVHACAAFTAGFVAAVVGTPADVMKTRLMNQPVGADGRRKTWTELIGRPDLARPDTKIRSHFVCSLHFDPSVIKYKAQLLPKALPTVSIPSYQPSKSNYSSEPKTQESSTQTK